jgi:hypothetical protein
MSFLDVPVGNSISYHRHLDCLGGSGEKHSLPRKRAMFFDMQPGDHLRLGEKAIAVVLSVENGRVEFAFEGEDTREMYCVPKSHENELYERRRDSGATDVRPTPN